MAEDPGRQRGLDAAAVVAAGTGPPRASRKNPTAAA
jgi:hypothetical protein